MVLHDHAGLKYTLEQITLVHKRPFLEQHVALSFEAEHEAGPFIVHLDAVDCRRMLVIQSVGETKNRSEFSNGQSMPWGKFYIGLMLRLRRRCSVIQGNMCYDIRLKLDSAY